jgi:hypothetical protein
MGHGLTSISLKGGDATKNGTDALCTAFKKNVEMSRTLTVLNLAGNKLDRYAWVLIAAGSLSRASSRACVCRVL